MCIRDRRSHVLLTVVAEDNITIHLVNGDLRGNLAFSTDAFTDTPPLRIPVSYTHLDVYKRQLPLKQQSCFSQIFLYFIR